MGNQNGEINPSGPSLFREWHAPDMVMINQIRREEHRGGSERGDHARDVRALTLVGNHPPSGGDKHSTQAVEAGIDCRKIRNAH